jgi:hypothetical protein
MVSIRIFTKQRIRKDFTAHYICTIFAEVLSKVRKIGTEIGIGKLTMKSEGEESARTGRIGSETQIFFRKKLFFS